MHPHPSAQTTSPCKQHPEKWKAAGTRQLSRTRALPVCVQSVSDSSRRYATVRRSNQEQFSRTIVWNRRPQKLQRENERMLTRDRWRERLKTEHVVNRNANSSNNRKTSVDSRILIVRDNRRKRIIKDNRRRLSIRDSNRNIKDNRMLNVRDNRKKRIIRDNKRLSARDKRKSTKDNWKPNIELSKKKRQSVKDKKRSNVPFKLNWIR
jgi:hypothetical protein